MKSLKLYSLFLFLLLMSCYDDKGNYDYQPEPVITVKGIPKDTSVVGSSEHLRLNPVITSSLEGVIKQDNPNFSFLYRMRLKAVASDGSGKWTVLNQNGNKELDTLANFVSGTYILWFTVTDKRTGVATSVQSELKVTSPVYEGYMVLCNEGAENRVRMDMISALGGGRVVPAYDVLEPLGLPALRNAVSIGWYPEVAADVNKDLIYVMTEEGSYRLDPNTFQTNEGENILNTHFMSPTTPGAAIRLYVVGSNGWWASGILCVNTLGNAFAFNPGAVNAAFEDPINTPVPNQAPAYRVAPYIGCGYARPGNTGSAVLYDVDNKRFIGWNQRNMQICTPLVNPKNPKFDFQTGMDLVYMEGTRFSNGLVYAVLQDEAGERYVYGINVAEDAMEQEAVYKINAPDFGKAEHFAFHSQYPFMYYSVGNKVYSYNFGTGVTNLVIPDLPANTEVTMLKFNLFMNPGEGWNPSEAFEAKQYDLIVATYDKNAADVNGGKLSFYKVQNTANTLSLIEDYSGFAKIVDVVYRERS